MFDENSNSTTASAATLAALGAAAATSSANVNPTAPNNVNAVAASAASGAPVNQTHIMSQLMNAKDSRWLQLEVCREFLRGQCSRNDVECKFAHPPPHVDVQNGRVTACYDSIKGRCTRENPKCKYLHPPQHLKDQLLINGKNTLAIKNLIATQLQNNGAAAALQPQIPVNLSQLLQQQQQQQQQQHPALVQAVPFQYYPHLFQYPLIPQGAADLYSVQAANGGPIPMKRPADKNATAGMPMYSPQAAAAAAAGNFNPYLPIPGYMPAVSFGQPSLPPRF